MEKTTFKIKGEYIKLGQLLKAANLVYSGAEAKIVIENGEVLVNGETEQRRGKKIVPGDTVVFEGKEILTEDDG